MTEKMQAMPSAKADRNKDRKEDLSGRTGGGESGGGAFKDKSQVPTEPGSFDGGQSRRPYHGGGDEQDGNGNENAVADHD